MSENYLNMIDLVIIHLTHPWGPPWTLGEMLENYQFPQKFQISPAFIWDLYMTFATATRTLDSSPLGWYGRREWWCYRKIAMSVLNFWLIFGSYHSIHMVGGQEKDFRPHLCPFAVWWNKIGDFWPKSGQAGLQSFCQEDKLSSSRLAQSVGLSCSINPD